MTMNPTQPPTAAEVEALIKEAVGKHLGPHLAIAPTPRYEAIVNEFVRAVLRIALASAPQVRAPEGEAELIAATEAWRDRNGPHSERVLLDRLASAALKWRYGITKQRAPQVRAGDGGDDERSIGQLIDERDAAEEALSQAYFLIVGHSPEWSNLFGYKEALADIDDAQSILRETAKTARGTP